MNDGEEADGAMSPKGVQRGNDLFHMESLYLGLKFLHVIVLFSINILKFMLNLNQYRS